MEMDETSNDFCMELQSLSPQASTDEKSLHRNWQQNKEALQKRLSIRRPVDDLVNNGIMMSPLKTPPCYAEKMRQLERAKTTDTLKQKIQHRPDAQSLVDRHILPEWPPDEIGGSPQVFEHQQMVKRSELMSSLSAKLEQRPGSLEMAEKGLLPLAPPMQTLLRDGSISYPRVDDTVLSDDIMEAAAAIAAKPPPSPAPSQPSRRARSRRGTGPSTSKVGNFVFHMYTPPKKEKEEEEDDDAVTPNTARDIQQLEYLRLQDSEDKQNVLMQQLVHDIRSRHDGGSPVKVKKTPLATAAYATFSGLAGLNVQQLKEECRRHKVPRTGNKLQLMRNLEPFQQEILRRYACSQLNPEDHTIRHSSSAPQLNPAVTREELKNEATSPQWSQPTTVILLNQPTTGPMTLQPMLQSMILQQGIMTTQAIPPPPPVPTPIMSQTTATAQTLLIQPPSTPEQIQSTEIEEVALVHRVEELEREIVKNIQESNSYKASHHGTRAEYIETQRQVLMINYTNTKRQAKLRIQERIDNARQRLIELCEKEALYKQQGDLRAVESLERERELTLSEYNQWNMYLDKLKATSTPNTSVSSDTRARSFTDSSNGNIPNPNVPISRSMNVGENEFCRTDFGQMNGNAIEMRKHLEKRLPSVEFQMLNEVLTQDAVGSKLVGQTKINGSGDCDFTTWLNEPYTQAPQPLNGCSVPEGREIPMSPMQTDLSSRCGTPHRPPQAGQTLPAEFSFDDLLCNPNMDITFPSLGGHPSAASMTEQILTPNTQSALYQFIQPDVVNMETDNDVFTP